MMGFNHDSEFTGVRVQIRGGVVNPKEKGNPTNTAVIQLNRRGING
jgi:hypothetical protein